MEAFKLKSCVSVFKALGDKNRIRILKMLEQKHLCVCEITAILGLAASTTSKHLSILKEAGLIFEEKEGKWVNYHLNMSARNIHADEMLKILKDWLNDDQSIRGDAEKMKTINRFDLCN